MTLTRIVLAAAAGLSALLAGLIVPLQRLAAGFDDAALAYTSLDPISADIYIIDLRTRATVNLTHHPAADTDPVWSPDGMQVAFLSNRNKDGPGLLGLYVVDVRTQTTRALTQPGLPTIREMGWSRDGSLVLFVLITSINQIIYAAPAAGGGPILELTPDDAIVQDFLEDVRVSRSGRYPSPDGDSLLSIELLESSGWTLVVRQGQAVNPIYDLDAVPLPLDRPPELIWLEDGLSVIFAYIGPSAASINRIDVATGDLHRIVDGYDPALRP
jgi:Tol biopolymer transport system component